MGGIGKVIDSFKHLLWKLIGAIGSAVEKFKEKYRR